MGRRKNSKNKSEKPTVQTRSQQNFSKVRKIAWTESDKNLIKDIMIENPHQKTPKKMAEAIFDQCKKKFKKYKNLDLKSLENIIKEIQSDMELAGQKQQDDIGSKLNKKDESDSDEEQSEESEEENDENDGNEKNSKKNGGGDSGGGSDTQKKNNGNEQESSDNTVVNVDDHKEIGNGKKSKKESNNQTKKRKLEDEVEFLRMQIENQKEIIESKIKKDLGMDFQVNQIGVNSNLHHSVTHTPIIGGSNNSGGVGGNNSGTGNNNSDGGGNKSGIGNSNSGNGHNQMTTKQTKLRTKTKIVTSMSYRINYTIIDDTVLNDRVVVVFPLFYFVVKEDRDPTKHFRKPLIIVNNAVVNNCSLRVEVSILKVNISKAHSSFSDLVQFNDEEKYDSCIISIDLPTNYMYQGFTDKYFDIGKDNLDNLGSFILIDCPCILEEFTNSNQLN